MANDVDQWGYDRRERFNLYAGLILGPTIPIAATYALLSANTPNGGIGMRVVHGIAAVTLNLPIIIPEIAAGTTAGSLSANYLREQRNARERMIPAAEAMQRPGKLLKEVSLTDMLRDRVFRYSPNEALITVDGEHGVLVSRDAAPLVDALRNMDKQWFDIEAFSNRDKIRSLARAEILYMGGQGTEYYHRSKNYDAARVVGVRERPGFFGRIGPQRFIPV